MKYPLIVILCLGLAALLMALDAKHAVTKIAYELDEHRNGVWRPTIPAGSHIPHPEKDKH